MSTFTVGKSAHNNDTKNASLAMKSRQQVINEVNKRRTLLQDNSWIKKRPEEEGTNENYGRVVLNQYKSQDNLHRVLEREGDEKAMLNRYRSDTTLDRIPARNDTNKINTSPVLDSRINKRYQDVDDFIQVNRTAKWDEKCHDLDSLIEVKDNNSKEGNKDLDDFIIVNCTFEQCDRSGYQDVEHFIEVNRISNQRGRSSDLDRFIEVKDRGNQGSDLDRFIEIKDRKNQCSDLDRFIEVKDRRNQGSDLDNFIEVKDRRNRGAIIDKELCTYCRKPLGTDTKMILEALQICCHATCFRCEICKTSLENLEAGDSIWIYKNRVHCAPCYAKVKATWIY